MLVDVVTQLYTQHDKGNLKKIFYKRVLFSICLKVTLSVPFH